MDEDTDDTNYNPFSLNRFVQQNVNDTADSSGSLSEFLKIHAPKSKLPGNSNAKLLDSENTNTLQDFVKGHLASNESASPLTSCTSHGVGTKGTKSDSSTDTVDGCVSLKEYTKFFLSSRENSTQKYKVNLLQDAANSKQRFSLKSNPDVTTVNENLSKIRISDTIDSAQAFNNSDSWNIDLTVALNNSTCKIVKLKQDDDQRSSDCDRIIQEIQPFSIPYELTSPLEDCTLDISSIVDEKLLYNKGAISTFGYVLSKKWSTSCLDKKFKVGVDWPYNPAEGFRFDSPSPDDINIKKRIK